MQRNADIASSRNHASSEPVAPGVEYLTTVFVNLYMVGAPDGPWILLDTGLPKTDALTLRVVEKRYGTGARPEAIILTHGHFDHAGSAGALADQWNVPIYAHPLELPYLTGRSDYPPQDPTMGGAIAFLSRFFPHTGYDFGTRVRPLPEDGSVPGMPDWRWIHTPGHTPGHVSLFREADRTLLAGDAFTTMDLDSWLANVTEEREIHQPPAPLTTDWDVARRSVERLADLEPATVAAGHGIPMAGPRGAARLRRFAEHFNPPQRGRYVGQPARADEGGVTYLPPPVPDPLPRRAAVAATAAAAAIIFLRGDRGAGSPRAATAPYRPDGRRRSRSAHDR
ncbi:MBL fold metallo-hydrolase [soil metagenome]